MEALKNVYVACVCVAYDCVSTMSTYILVFDQCLYIPSLDVNLLCVDQLRDHGLKVNDVPLIRLSADERTNESHSIVCKETGLHVPLNFDKPISYFKCRVPTTDEVESTHNTTVNMTSSVKWEPYDKNTNQMEENIRQQILLKRREIDTLISYSNPYVSSCPSNTKGKISSVRTNGKSYIIKPESRQEVENESRLCNSYT